MKLYVLKQALSAVPKIEHGLNDTTCVGSFGVTIRVLLHPSISTALLRNKRSKQYAWTYENGAKELKPWPKWAVDDIKIQGFQ